MKKHAEFQKNCMWGTWIFLGVKKKVFLAKNCEKFYFGEIFFLLINDKYRYHLKGLSRKICNFLSLWAVRGHRTKLGPKLAVFSSGL